MTDTLLFQFGVFVVLLFLAGIVYTMREFSQMNESNQREWKNEKKDMHIQDQSN